MRIAFDLDGTLIDSLDHIHQSVSLALAECAMPPVDRATMQSFVGNGLPSAMTRLLAHLKQPAERHAELTRQVMVHYVSLPSDPQSVYPGAKTALGACRDAGHHLSLCTNKPYQATLNVLRDTGLTAFFDLIIGGDSLPSRKPAPQMLKACAPDLYVGDSEVDAETAQAAGIPFLLYTKGYHKSPPAQIPHDALFDHHDALPELAQAHGLG